MAAFALTSKAEQLQKKYYSLQILKYLLSGPFQNKFANPCYIKMKVNSLQLPWAMWMIFTNKILNERSQHK